MTRLSRLHPAGLISLAVLAAVVATQIVYAIGAAAGASYDFTTPTGPAHVDQLTVFGFTALPLAVGLGAAAVLGRIWSPVLIVAMVVAPVLELGSIAGMTLPSDHDLASKVALSACHVVLVPVTLLALAALRHRARSNP